jgi:uncharacterized protein
MREQHTPPKVDIKQAGQSAMQISGRDLLQNYERLTHETTGLGALNPLEWSAHFDLKPDQAGRAQVWLQLKVKVTLPQTCQRCLGPVDVPIEVERAFRFVDNEAQAELEDDESPEDLLVTSRDFDLAGLIEDEVLMDLPVVPRHDSCPVAVKLTVADADFEAEVAKPNPFAVLAGLKGAGKS